MWTAESASFDLTMDRQEKDVAREFKAIDGPTRLSLAFQSTADRGSLALFHRYETTLRRSWERASDRPRTARNAQDSASQRHFMSESACTNWNQPHG